MDWITFKGDEDYRLRTKHWFPPLFPSLAFMMKEPYTYPLMRASMTVPPSYTFPDKEGVTYSYYNYDIDNDFAAALKQRQWVDDETRGHLYVYPRPLNLGRYINVEPAADLSKIDAMRLFSNGKESLKNFNRNKALADMTATIESVAAACDADLLMKVGDSVVSVVGYYANMDAYRAKDLETGQLVACLHMSVAFLKKA